MVDGFQEVFHMCHLLILQPTSVLGFFWFPVAYSYLSPVPPTSFSSLKFVQVLRALAFTLKPIP
jgi:hypothetical protein